MPDSFQNYAQLQTEYRNGRDFRICHADRGGELLILAPHGGGIEPGTSEIAVALAGDDLSYYLFEGLGQTGRDNRRLHLTSARFDEPQCLDLVTRYQTALAVHGYLNREPMIVIGGRDLELKARLMAELSARGWPVQIGTDGYAGTLRSNICNRTRSGKGVQLEFSDGLRKPLFADWQYRIGRKTTTDQFLQLVTAIRSVIDP